MARGPRSSRPLSSSARATQKAAKQVRADALKRTLESRVLTAASKLATRAPTFGKVGKTYETWVMFEIASRLQAYARVAPLTHAGKPTRGRFRVRGGPGNIPAASRRERLPCHFEIRGKTTVLELHNSVKHRGVSYDLHELDVSAVFKFVTNALRNAKGGPYWGPRAYGVELKAYDETGTLNKNFGRALVGIAVDLEWGRHMRPWLGIAGPFEPRFALITTAKLTPESARYLVTYDVLPGASTRPGAESALDDVTHSIKLWL